MSDLALDARIMQMFDADLVGEPSLAQAAVRLATLGWQVFPLAAGSKVPRRGSRGFHDATDDVDQVVAWWDQNPAANIGLAVPAGVLVVDIDPRNGGDRNLEELQIAHGDLTETLTVRSGGGGWHYYYRHDAGPVTSTRLPAGVEYKGPGGYLVAPPSVVGTGRYEWHLDTNLAQLPAWFAQLIRPEVRVPTTRPITRRTGVFAQLVTTPWEWFDRHHTWGDVLGHLIPVPWQLVAGDGESDGSRWRHPTATSSTSATVRHGCLFAYSPNTGLATTAGGVPNGYSKYRAWRTLNGLDTRVAARTARAMMREAGHAA